MSAERVHQAFEGLRPLLRTFAEGYVKMEAEWHELIHKKAGGTPDPWTADDEVELMFVEAMRDSLYQHRKTHIGLLRQQIKAPA